MSFSHHLAFVVCRPASVVCKLLQKSSPLKLLGQILPNLATIILGVSSLKNVWRDLSNQPRWPPWLKIEHRGKMQFLAYNSKTKAFRANLTWGKIVDQVKIYLPWNFQTIRTTCCWVAAPELVILSKFCSFWLLSWILEYWAAIMFSKVRPTNKSTWPKLSVDPLRSCCPL